MWLFSKSNNKSTTIILMLLVFLLTTKMPTTNTTITKPTTSTLMSPTNSTTSLEANKKSKDKQLDQQIDGQEHIMDYVDSTPSFNFDVVLRGNLPLHKDNFLASLVNGNHNSHAVGSAKPSFHHNSHNKSISSDIYKNKIISHTQYFNSLDPVDYNNIDMNADRGKSLLPIVPITTTTTTISTPITTYPPPVFDFGVPRNITARAGQIASITCRVEHLGDKSVSWIRKRDLHILTAGMLTYTSDERFKVLRTADSRSWSLHVKYAQPRDSGVYECQVNTEPKISMAFRLKVIVTPPDAKAIIVGPTDLYVKVGSMITLTCHVKQPSSAHDIGRIYWYRGPYVLTPFEIHSNDAAIDLQRISMESKLVEQLQSRLRIANAQTIDSGNYTCMPTTAEAASVTVNVINDESPAAMQKSSSTTTRISRNTFRKMKWYLLHIILSILHYSYYHHHHYRHHMEMAVS